MLDVDLLALSGVISTAFVASVVMMRSLYIALANERRERARERSEFEETMRLIDGRLRAPVPPRLAPPDPEPLLDVGGYRSNPRPAPVLAVARVEASPPPAWHIAPVASMLREF